MERRTSTLLLIAVVFVSLWMSGCIISAYPGNVTLCPYESQTFSVKDLAENPKVYEWSLDGVVISGATGSSYTYTALPTDVGTHTLTVKILWDSHTWTITVNDCAQWTVAPEALDFGYIQTDKTIVVTNTGPVPFTVSADRSATLAFVTDVVAPTGQIPAGQSGEVTVKVDRQGLAWGLYTTSFVLKNDKGGAVTVTVNMNVGTAKVLFTVDTSGSMKDTDPNDMRVSAVKATIAKFIDNANVSFGIIDFDTTAKTITSFIRDQALLETDANKLADDNGWTNYLGAAPYTTGALDLIDSLIDETETATHFVVIFLSDGEPTVGNQSHDAIVTKVAAIVAPGNVKLYTIYLNGRPNTTAQTLLNDMAIAGGTGGTHVYTDPDSLSFLSLDF